MTRARRMPSGPLLKLENWVSMMLTLLARERGITLTTCCCLAVLLPAGQTGQAEPHVHTTACSGMLRDPLHLFCLQNRGKANEPCCKYQHLL